MPLGERGQGGKFFFDEVDGSGACQGEVEAFVGGVEVIEIQRGSALKASGTDEIEFLASDSSQFPGTIR